MLRQYAATTLGVLAATPVGNFLAPWTARCSAGGVLVEHTWPAPRWVGVRHCDRMGVLKTVHVSISTHSLSIKKLARLTRCFGLRIRTPRAPAFGHIIAPSYHSHVQTPWCHFGVLPFALRSGRTNPPRALSSRITIGSPAWRVGVG